MQGKTIHKLTWMKSMFLDIVATGLSRILQQLRELSWTVLWMDSGLWLGKIVWIARIVLTCKEGLPEGHFPSL